MNIVNVGPVLNGGLRAKLNLSFSFDEIKNALWSIPDGKAPGLDGYNSKFYKVAWPIVGKDVIDAIQLLFVNDKLLKS